MMTKKKFKRGQLLQDECTAKIYIYVKRFGNKQAHLVELDDHGDPVGLVLLEKLHLGPVKLIPETFKGINIL